MRISTIFSSLIRATFVLLFVLLGAACTQLENPNDSFSKTWLDTPPVLSWPTNGGSLNNQRWSPLEQINQSNVNQLRGVWRTHLNGSGMDVRNSGEAQPLVHKGVIYNITGDNDVFAVSVKSGKILWTYKANFPSTLGRSICCGWTSRGLGMGEGLIFVGQLDSKLIALDQLSGEIVWEKQGMRWQEGYSISSAPLYYDGMVITGFSGGEYGVRGLVKAYNASTGDELWTFYTIPGPGEFGHTSWPQNTKAWEHGGGAVWQTPAVDPELGLLYFSTGNPGPDYNGAVRPGDNLFANSIIAIDVHSGEYRWHFQEVHHDIWDYDASNPVILFDIELKHETRHAISQAGKTGWVYILDRITGEPLIGIEEREVLQETEQATAKTQPYVIGDSFVPQFIDAAPVGVALINQGRIFTPYGPDRPAMVQPSPAGSANWAPSTYDPNRQVMYICAAESAMTLQGGGSDFTIPDNLDGNMYLGGGFSNIGKPQSGIISAMDMSTNTLVWQKNWPDICYSGFVATAGDLLFVGRNDGRLTALDIDTGEQLWEFQTGAGMNSTVSIFEDNGQQYIVAYSAGNRFAGSKRGDSLWLFSLGGTLLEVEK